MTPWEKYQQDLERDDFKFDPAQENAVRELQRLYDDLMLQGMPKSSLASKMKAIFGAKSASHSNIKGIYFSVVSKTGPVLSGGPGNCLRSVHCCYCRL